jgi:hypothetical protein
MPSGLVPNHKQSMALFLERVYGVEDRDLFFKLLEDAFLPDLRAATMLEKVTPSSFYTYNCILTSLKKSNLKDNIKKFVKNI